MSLQGLVEQGIILQVVRGELTTKFASSATSTYVDIGLSAGITPKSTTSEILIHVTVWSGGINDAYPFFRLLRDSTEIGSGTGNSGSNNVNAFMGGFFTAIASMTHRQHCLNRHYIDNPATLNTITYKIQGKNAYTAGGAGIVYVNRANTDGDHAYVGCCQSEIVLMKLQR